MAERTRREVHRETTSIRIDRELWYAARIYALKQRVTVGELVENLLKRELQQTGEA
jgi:predicted HicB family RNase H-like nuclease